MDVSFFQDILTRISDKGRQLLDIPLQNVEQPNIQESCRALVSSRGEAASVALARQILDSYLGFDYEDKDTFFAFLTINFQPNTEDVAAVARAYLENPAQPTFEALSRVVEPLLQELLRRLNLAPGGTAALVKMREDLLDRMKNKPELASLDRDFMHLFNSWFNRGFLVLSRISWSSPASVLEKIIAYEAVHEIRGWSDLRRRLDPADRRCFAFFHPALVDDPLIFVEVALDADIPSSIQMLIDEDGGLVSTGVAPTVAVFYSISNCQEGLRGISFGNFLLKQVVEDLSRDIPSLRTFVTLSPAPGFRSWLYRALDSGHLRYLTDEQRNLLEDVRSHGLPEDEAVQDALKPAVMAAASEYYLLAKDRYGKPLDPVARFHLGNGARLERINWLGDVSQNGVLQSVSIMVNYRYELKDIERNHEAYINHSVVSASKAIKSTLLAPEKSRALVLANE